MKLSRRALFRIAALTGIGASLGFAEWQTQPVGLTTYLRWFIAGRRKQLEDAATVALLQVPSYEADLLGRLREGWTLAGLPSVAGKRIHIKPNMVDQFEARPIHTHPKLVGALIDLLREQGAAVITVGDGPAFRRDGRAVAAEAGLLAELQARGMDFVDLNYDNPAPVPIPPGWFQRDTVLWLPASIRQADLIVSVPKMKTHHWSTVSLAMKNFFGVVPGARYGWPKNILHMNGLEASILAILSVLPPTVGIIDGITGMEGDGPLYGTPIEHGLLAMGDDLVALDFACTRLMGLDPLTIPYLQLAAWSGLGHGDKIRYVGAPFASMQRTYIVPPTLETLTG